MAEVKPPAYLGLLESGDYSDFIIECQGIEFKVHRAIVCPLSTMLQKAVSGPFKVSSLYDQVDPTTLILTIRQEAQDGRINLTEEDPKILSRVLLFLYTNDYDANDVPNFLQAVAGMSTTQSSMPASEATNPSPMSYLKIHALVYKYADMLGIESLKILASSRFLDQVPAACTSSEFAEPLKVMYEATRSDDFYLRIPVTRSCLLNHLDVVKCEKTLAVIQEYEPNVWSVAVPILEEAKAAGVATAKEARTKTIEWTLREVNARRVCIGMGPHVGLEPLRNLNAGVKYKLQRSGTIIGYCSSCAGGVK